MAQEATPGTISKRKRRDFIDRVWLVVLIVLTAGGGIVLLWLAYKVALLFLAAVLLAIFLRTLTMWVVRLTRLQAGWSLAIVILVLLSSCGLVGWLLAAPISEEATQITQQFPKALSQLQGNLEHYTWGRTMLQRLNEPSGLLSQSGKLFNKLSSMFSITIESVIYAWVILFCAFYLAVQPEFYVEGFLRLLPVTQRARGLVVLNRIDQGLKHWLFGQILSMAIIGVLTWLGLFLLRIPLSAALGVLAGVLDFVPVAGPWVAGIISCVFALLRSPMHAVYVACLFVGLHLLEGHVIIPQVQKQATRLPPALTVLSMVLFALLFGFLGLFLATPLLALVLICTKALYVENVVEK